MVSVPPDAPPRITVDLALEYDLSTGHATGNGKLNGVPTLFDVSNIPDLVLDAENRSAGTAFITYPAHQDANGVFHLLTSTGLKTATIAEIL